MSSRGATGHTRALGRAEPTGPSVVAVPESDDAPLRQGSHPATGTAIKSATVGSARENRWTCRAVRAWTIRVASAPSLHLAWPGPARDAIITRAPARRQDTWALA